VENLNPTEILATTPATDLNSLLTVPRAMDRAAIDTDTLVRIALILVVLWLALEVLDSVLGMLGRVFWFLQPLLGLVLVVILILWLLDRI
jgi:hypothetical protein